MELAPPTWVTLWHLAGAKDMEDVITAAADRAPRRYATHIARDGSATLALWAGDAGYDDRDATRAGDRHRLVMHPAGWRFEARVENLADRDYELVSGYNTPGRSGLLSLRWDGE